MDSRIASVLRQLTAIRSLSLNSSCNKLRIPMKIATLLGRIQ